MVAGAEQVEVVVAEEGRHSWPVTGTKTSPQMDQVPEMFTL